MRLLWSIGLGTTLLASVTGATANGGEGWKTYRNEKFGYELSYPPEMDYTAYRDGASGELKDTRTRHRLVEFEVWPPDECPRQPADATAKAVGIERAKTMTQADGPDGASTCGDPVTVRTYAARHGATIYELELTCIRETDPDSHDDTDDAAPDAVPPATPVVLVVVLVDRINKPSKRFLSTFEDYFTWALTFLPVLTGYLAVKHLLLPYTTLLALHILSVELLLIAIPFTKLFHGITVFASRWYNGDINGRKGVSV